MGIVNVTPDSFSDGGQFAATDRAVEHGLRLAAEGADILDIGGESSRPGSKPVSLEEELTRVIPVVRQLASQVTIPVSVDTTKAEVARQALAAGAAIINDISAGLGDPDMAEVVRASGAGIVLMHMQGVPETMHLRPAYGDVVTEVRDFLSERVSAFQSVGVALDQIVVDPGISFGKTFEHNLLLLRNLEKIASIGRPVLLGVSRKGMLGTITGRPVTERAVASIAVGCYCVSRGSAHILRVHDVAATVDAAKIVGAISAA
ncbi:MAG TPA: dihydropteroate synthase [Gemmataceae bacterium]|nr:dihydropteroate synthase [Gemmataceae bacterium]